MRPAAPLPDPLLATARAQAGLLDAQQCDAAGVTSARRAALRRAGVLLPVVTGVHDAAPSLDEAAEGDRVRWAGDLLRHGRRRAAWSALLALGRTRAVAVSTCALALLDVEGLPTRVRPEAALLDGSHRAPGGGIRVRCVRPGEVRRVGTALVVDPREALAQAVCELDREHAVAVLDSAVQRRVVDADDLATVRRLVRGRRGSRRTVDWWALVDGRAQSPLETWARLQCGDAGVPPHDLQVPVRDRDGRVIARGDMGWWLPAGGLLVAEIDGAGPHGAPDALFRDRQRQNAVVATGTLMLRFTAADLRAGRVAASVSRHLAPARPG